MCLGTLLFKWCLLDSLPCLAYRYKSDRGDRMPKSTCFQAFSRLLPAQIPILDHPLIEPRKPWTANRKLLGPAFDRTDFSRIFIFEPPDFFADFLAGFFLLIFVEKVPRKTPPGKSPAKSSKIYTTKNPPTHFCRLPRAKAVVEHRLLFLPVMKKTPLQPLSELTFWVWPEPMHGRSQKEKSLLRKPDSP